MLFSKRNYNMLHKRYAGRKIALLWHVNGKVYSRIGTLHLMEAGALFSGQVYLCLDDGTVCFIKGKPCALHYGEKVVVTHNAMGSTIATDYGIYEIRYADRA
jgi:hypothetical protein